MPELPEVHTFQQYFNEAALGERIQQVIISDDHVIRNVDGETFASRLAKRTFVSSYRRGKYLFAHLDNGHDVLLHFGMTGDLRLYSELEDRPRFERFAFLFESGNRLAFEDARKFGRILYLEDRDAYIREAGLGEDALEISEEDFLAAMADRKTSLKGFLLNQKLLAGVGNLYADEICYQTRIHPASTVKALRLADRKRIYSCMQEVLQLAVAHNPDYRAYPEEWFWKIWRHEGYLTPDGKSIVEKATVAGRTTFYAPGWQRLFS